MPLRVLAVPLALGRGSGDGRVGTAVHVSQVQPAGPGLAVGAVEAAQRIPGSAPQMLSPKVIPCSPAAGWARPSDPCGHSVQKMGSGPQLSLKKLCPIQSQVEQLMGNVRGVQPLAGRFCAAWPAEARGRQPKPCRACLSDMGSLRTRCGGEARKHRPLSLLGAF